DAHCFGVVDDGVQSDGDHQSVCRDLNTSQITCRYRLGLEVGVGESRHREDVRTACVESDVSIGADTSQEKSNATFVTNPLLVVTAPLIDHVDGSLLDFLKVIDEVPESE